MLYEEYLSYLQENTNLLQSSHSNQQKLQLEIDILETTLCHLQQIRYELEQKLAAVVTTSSKEVNNTRR